MLIFLQCTGFFFISSSSMQYCSKFWAWYFIYVFIHLFIHSFIYLTYRLFFVLKSKGSVTQTLENIYLCLQKHFAKKNPVKFILLLRISWIKRHSPWPVSQTGLNGCVFRNR